MMLKGVFFFLKVFLSIASAQVSFFLLSSDYNEGAFAVKERDTNLCFAGRKDSKHRDYDALLGICSGKCESFILSSPQEDYSYTVETFKNFCVAGVVTLCDGDMDMLVVVYSKEGIRGKVYLGGKLQDMLWYLKRVDGGYLAVGGVQDGDWDILVLKLDEELKLLWTKRFGTSAQEYAYGAVEWRGRYIVVGRSNYRGNWDGFFLELSSTGELVDSYLFGGNGKDYLRYIGLVEGEPLAVGRTESTGDSDVLLIFPKMGKFVVYDSGSFDYGRAFELTDRGLVLVGDIYRDGSFEGFILFLDKELNPVEGYALGGYDTESLRFIDGKYFVGYSYSFTMDNDVLLGSLEGSCPGFLEKVNFHRKRGSLKFWEYPLSLRQYRLERFGCEFSISRANLRVIKACQE